MIKLETLRFGLIEYKEKEIINFEKGLPGFENEHHFILIQPEEEQPYAFLQSTQTKELSFIIANPFLFYINYEFDLDEQSKEELNIGSIEDVMVWSILSIPDDFKKTTMNLKAPVIINAKNRKGKQVILNDNRYQIKYPLFTEKVKEEDK